MFETFQLKSGGAGLMGYYWPASEPRAAVCLIHGAGEHAGRYSRVTEYFAEHHISSLAMDLRGHGCSVGHRGHIGPRATVLRDVDNLILSARKRCEGLPIVVYGHSIGGNIVLDYRLRGGMSAVPTAWIVSSPWLKLCRLPSLPIRCLVRVLSAVRPQTRLRGKIAPELRGNLRIVEGVARDHLLHDSISAMTALEGYEIAKKLLDGRIADRFGGGKKPVIVMHGTLDKICSIEGARAFAAREGDVCSLIEWEGYFHELHNGSESETGIAVVQKMTEIILAACAT
jgi:alpha-beta hydrolase superfamily lysophospholipase